MTETAPFSTITEPTMTDSGVMGSATTDHRPLRTGLKAAWPLIAGMAPFGVVVGVAAATQHADALPMLGGSGLLFAGTAQMAAFALISAGAAPFAVLATVVIVNARLLMYGAALEPHFRAQPLWFRLFGPMLIVDQTFAVATAEPSRPPAIFRRYWLTLGLTVLTGWVLAIAVGMIAGPALPEGLPLDSAATSCLIGLLVPRMTNRGALAAALTGALVAALAAELPAGLGVLTGTIAGLLAGAWCTRGRS